jgi:hypothetical protein
MAVCEKCWRDSFKMMMATGKPQHKCYQELLESRKNSPCSPKEQAGEWWDEEKKKDRRLPWK